MGGSDGDAHIKGLGLDVVELHRFERLLARSPEFATRYFAVAEQSRCRRHARPAQAFAITFAVKEAVLKALGAGVLGPIVLADLEVTLGRGGALVAGVRTAAVALARVHVHATWAADRERAWAFAILV